MVESTSLELFKKPADVALADVGFGGLGSAGRMMGLDLGELLQPEQFYGVGDECVVCEDRDGEPSGGSCRNELAGGPVVPYKAPQS